MDMVAQISEKVNKVFDAAYLAQLAREEGFIKRERKIDAKGFLENHLVSGMENTPASIADVAFEFSKNNVEVSKQALHKKYTKEATAFIQRVLKELLDHSSSSPLFPVATLPFVRQIKTVDSSFIKLNKQLKDVFPGLRNHGATLKIQAMMNTVTNQMNLLEICPARENDQGYQTYLEQIEPGDLSINDLGYFCLDAFKKIQDKKAFFLSRHLKKTNVYVPNVEGNITRLNILKYLRTTQENSIALNILLGESKLACRMVALRLPPEAYRQRLKNIKEKQRKNGHAKSKSSSLDEWSIFVTNLPEFVTGDSLLALYGIRWQIELLFKMAKTFLNLRKVNHPNEQKTLISIYLSLIAITLLGLCSMTIIEEEISLYKACKILRRGIRDFLQLITLKKDPISWLAQKIMQFAKKESYKKRLSTKHLIGVSYA